MRILICLSAALLSTAATARPDVDFSAAQTRSFRANSPLVLQLSEARNLGGDKLLMSLKLWSSTHYPVLAAIPAGHAGWRLQGSDGSAVQGARFQTPNRPSITTTGTGGHNEFFARFGDPVTIPVIVDYTVVQRKPVSLEVVILACNRPYRVIGTGGRCHPQSFTFSNFVAS